MTLSEIALQYVAFRKSMGEDFASTESLLKTFCRHMGGNVELADITAEDVQGFLVGAGVVSGYWRRKYDLLRGLYRYAISRGFIDCAPLPRNAVRAPRFKPYIYTEEEMRRLLNAITICLTPPAQTGTLHTKSNIAAALRRRTTSWGGCKIDCGRCGCARFGNYHSKHEVLQDTACPAWSSA
jgi:hypothetical protein